MNEMIFKRAAYEALKHEAETHELPASKEAYERAARIIDQMPAAINALYCDTDSIYVDIRDGQCKIIGRCTNNGS